MVQDVRSASEVFDIHTVTEARRMIRGHRWAFALATLLAIGAVAAAAAMNPRITSGSVGITGSGTIVVTGRVLIFGTVSGPRPIIDITTTNSVEHATIGGKPWTIGRKAVVDLQLPSGKTAIYMSPTTTNIRVKLRGAKISMTVAGKATITFSGSGTYYPTFSGKTKKWPRTPLELQ
jgi:hypothetical protein